MSDKTHDFTETVKKCLENKKRKAAERAKSNKNVVRLHGLKK